MQAASVTATITGSGPERWVHADVTIRPGIPQFAIHGITKDAAIKVRHMVRSSFEKAGKSMPSGTITADMDFELPFEGIPELSITLATAMLLASKQISPDALNNVALMRNGQERILLSPTLAVP